MRKLRDNSSRPETLGTRARDEVKRAIMSGRFRPGEKITIRALATALNVSITPAREALANLVAEGVLDISDFGTISIPSLDKRRVRELVNVRECLEGLAAREACKHLTEEDLQKLESLHKRLEKANTVQDYAAVIRLNWEFHFALYRRAEMPLLLKMIEACWLQAGSYLNVIYPDYGEISVGIRNHRAILDAAIRRKPGELASAVVRDIELAAQSLLAHIDDAPEPPFSGVALNPRNATGRIAKKKRSH
jgi:DNA-binding GntR family transcriptional regulator